MDAVSTTDSIAEPSTGSTAEPSAGSTGSTTGSTAEMPVDMRARLLDAALTVLDRDGAAGLTVRAITQQAGCSTTGVYTYFGGKHGLVEAIYLDGFESFDRAVSDRLIAGEVLEAGRAYRRWAIANPTHYMVMFGRAVPDFVPSEEAMERAGQSFQTLVDAVAALGAPDPFATAYHVYATVHGYVMLELVGLGPADPQALDALYEAGLTECTDLGAGDRR